MGHPPSEVDERRPEAPVTGPQQAARDDTTRYLCAAAHLDPGFADAAIKEFLIEPTRAIPPSPGVDDAAVLSEAVAARTRRKLRDTVLIVLSVGLAFALPITLLLIWIGVALAWSYRAVSSRARSDRAAKNSSLLLALSIGVIVLILVAPFVLNSIQNSVSGRSRDAIEISLGNGNADTILGIVLFVLIVAVLVADTFTVWNLVIRRFGKHTTQGRPLPSIADRRILQYSPPAYLAQLSRYLHPMRTMAPDPGTSAGEPVPVIVHRGYKPFVGAGAAYRAWSIAVALEKSGEPTTDTPLTTMGLYLGVAEDIDKLRRETSLTPGMRLRELTIDEQIIVPAKELLDHLDDPAARDLLPHLSRPPHAFLSERRSLEIRDDPVEWARYYLCLQVETWDRDLVRTIYLHVAVDESTLYVEWTPCLLYPINARYQEIDTRSRSLVLPLWESLVTLIRLPASLPGRLWHTLKVIRPPHRDRGMLDPEMFGSLFTLRELAADNGVHNYFQFLDADRYLKILASRFVQSVIRLMREAGYSTAAFENQATMVFTNNVHIGGSVTGNVLAGSGNTAGNVGAPAPGATTTTGAG